MFENIYSEVLIASLENQEIISDKQHGFRKRHSTCTNLLEFWDKITDLADQRNPISIIYTDLRKAFDSVPHDLLLLKLEGYGIRGNNLAWLRNYLHGRKQKVLVNGTTSNCVDVESGVPQGGVLSGKVFSLYVNDLPDVIKTCTMSLYADDAKLFAPVSSNEDINNIQNDLDALIKWCDKWRLRVNSEKCFFLQYNPINTKNPILPSYSILGRVLDRRHEAKDLGIISATT